MRCPIRVVDTVSYRPVRSVSAHIRYSLPPYPSCPTFWLISDDSGVPGESRPRSYYRDFRSGFCRSRLEAVTRAIATEREREREREREACRVVIDCNPRKTDTCVCTSP
ncbi:hypothetical protein RHMOL_Rhmol04G0324500 [Rhododendron molle]|uniref:Uncharacterized protein n=1 Tax=Rhododendron molle TaxID=49168 RepID=A0ACC0P7W9_RHOML|nr:hypothetical protein RHMOL_Rhmol04G0324500 [Rhododendron molle]